MSVVLASSNAKDKGKAVDDSPSRSHHTSSSSSASASESEDASSSSSDASDSDSDFGEVSPEYLESLIEKAKANMSNRLRKDVHETVQEEEEIYLGGGKETGTDNLPSLDPGKLPPAYFTFRGSWRDGASLVRDVDAEKAEQASSSLVAPTAPAPPDDRTKDGKPLTKKEKKALKNTSTGWSDLPVPDAADLPRLHREVEALRLRNTLDPKRFYRKEEGEGKGIKGLPKRFAIGTIIPSTTPFGTASADNLTRAERKRTIVDELVDDAEAKRYAKKKFEDLQGVRGAKGRGTLAKKKALRKSKW